MNQAIESFENTEGQENKIQKVEYQLEEENHEFIMVNFIFHDRRMKVLI